MLVVFAVGALAFLVGSTFILMAAFRKRLWWGLGVLLVPTCVGVLGVFLPAQGIAISGWLLPVLLVPLVVVIIFVVLHWRQAYMGVFVALTGMMLAVGAVFGGADRQLQRYLDRAGIDEVSVEVPVQRPEDIVIPNAKEIAASGLERADPDERESYTVFKVTPLAPRGSIRLPSKEVAKRVYRATSLDQDLRAYAGMSAKILTHDGQQHEGRLVEVQADGVFLEAAVSGGRVTYEYRMEDIARLEVLLPASSGTGGHPPEGGTAGGLTAQEPTQPAPQESLQSTAPMPSRSGSAPTEAAVDVPEALTPANSSASGPLSNELSTGAPTDAVPGQFDPTDASARPPVAVDATASGNVTPSSERTDPEATKPHDPPTGSASLQEAVSGQLPENLAPRKPPPGHVVADHSAKASRAEEAETFVSSD